MPSHSRSELATSGFIIVCICALLAFYRAPLEASEPVAGSDLKAAQLAERTLEAMGGASAWEATRFLRFTFAGARTHWWDRQTGRHRLEGTSREDGKHYVVLHNLDQRIGEVYLEGKLLSGREAEEWLDRAHGAWINDTYWLLMPYKLLDPGVSLSYEGKKDFAGKSAETLLLTFDRVGLTPGDRYWVYIDPETKLVCGWAYKLESYEPDQPATGWTWGNWRRFGQILLASDRQMVDGDRELPLADIGVFDSLPDSIFEDPAPVSDS